MAAARLQQLLGESAIDPFDVLPDAQAQSLMPVLEPFEQPDPADVSANIEPMHDGII